MDFKLPDQFKDFFRPVKETVEFFRDPYEGFKKRKETVVDLGQTYLRKARELEEETPFYKKLFPSVAGGETIKKFTGMKSWKERFKESPAGAMTELAMMLEAPVTPRGPMTPQMARKVLKVKPNATQSEIAIATENLLKSEKFVKGEFPKDLTKLANFRKANVGDLVYEAASVLWEKAKGAATGPLMKTGLPATTGTAPRPDTIKPLKPPTKQPPAKGGVGKVVEMKAVPGKGIIKEIPTNKIEIVESGPRPQTPSVTKGPIEVVRDTKTGKYYLYDGGHRLEEAQARGEKNILAKVAEGEPVGKEGFNIIEPPPAKGGVGKELEPLAKEARKYKSAEEFVKAKGDKIYHQSTEKGMPQFDAFFGTEKFQKTFPQEFGKELMEGVLPKNAKVLNLDLASKEGREFMAEAAKKAFPDDVAFQKQLLNDPFVATDFDKVSRNTLADEFYSEVWTEKIHAIEALKNTKFKDYDAVLFNEELLVPKKTINKIKTKSQLTDIWNKANKSVAQPPAKGGAVAEQPRTTIKKLEKERLTERIDSMLTESKSQEDYVKRVKSVEKRLDKVGGDKKKLKQIRAALNNQIKKLTGYEMTSNYKQNYSMLQTLMKDPEIKEAAEALEELMWKIDGMTGGKTRKKLFETSEKNPNLPAEGKYYIPYGKYTTRGTGNREWVQQTIPLVYMGNKRQMVGYLLDALNIKQKDLGNITPADVKHLDRFKNVYDIFGGSGLLTSLSKKLFRKAKFQYNEYDPDVLKALERVKDNPEPIKKFILQVGKYLKDSPGADWLSHFKLLYKRDPDFRAAAKLIEATAGRTSELTANKLSNLVKAVPNFAKVFKDVTMTNKDALKIMDKLAKSGSSSDFVWIDPPYLWSAGYNKGAEMERAEGFMMLLDKLEKLDKAGVKFVFTNNDPQVQVKKAGLEGVHLDNIVGRMNRLTEEMVVVHGVKPIGTAREEIIVTNLPEAKESLGLLVQDEVERRIAELRADPMAAPKEMLKFWREIRGSSRFVPEGEKITPHQVRTIRSLRKRIQVNAREMLPVLDDLLGDTSFAKMTKEDGKRMIEWLQPRNWEVIENKIAMVREMQAQERRELAVGEKFASKQEDLESKYGVIGLMNKTVSEIANLGAMLEFIPMPKPAEAGLLKSLLQFPARHISESQGASLLGIKVGFQTPMRTVINISRNHENRMKDGLSKVFKDLSEAEKKQVVYLQAGAKKFYKGKITDRARAVAKYVQEVSEANIAITNRLRAAKGQPPLKVRKPYIPYIIEENLNMAANLFDRVRFWEQRTKTPRDFAVGLFEKDPGRIIEVWAESSASWLKKNLYGAFLMDRYQAIGRGQGPAVYYAKEMMERDIYDMLPDSEKFYRSIGHAINQRVGSILPKKVPVDEALAESILNTSFGKELADNIKEGYLEVPRVQIPNIGSVFMKVFYPAKLAWNWSFALLNRTQPWAGLPFVGIESQLAGRLKLYGSMFPWNRKTRKDYIDILESSGYEFGRILAGQELPQFKQKIGMIVDRSVNFLGDITELANRLENMYGFEYYLTKKVEKKTGVSISSEDKKKMAAQFSAFINFLSGKGYSPVGQRGMIARFLYIFNQYPINQIEVMSEMVKVSLKDKGTKEFLQMLGREGGINPKVVEAFEKMPPKSKANLFLVFLAIAIPVATLYALSRSWNIASRALPSMPRISMSDLVSAVGGWIEDPTSEDAKDRLISEWKNFTRVTAVGRLEDALNVYNYGMLETTTTGRPIFVDQALVNAAMVYLFGRSSLEEYEKMYPSVLGRTLGGQTAAGELKKLEEEMAEESKETREAAIELLKLVLSNPTKEEATSKIKEMAEAGRINKKVLDKVGGYMEEKMAGQGMLERGIIGLNDKQQAKLVLDKMAKIKTKDEARELLADLIVKEILTKNVLAEMEKLAKEGYRPKENLFQQFFSK